MKKLIYGSLFLAIVGIGIVGCKKETIKPTTTTQSFTESQKRDLNFDNTYKVASDGKMLVFESSDSYEEAISNLDSIHVVNFFSTIKALQFQTKRSTTSNDIYLDNILNDDLAVQIGEYIYRVNMEKQKVFVLSAKFINQYSDLVNENIKNTNIQVYSTEENVIELVENGNPSQKGWFCKARKANQNSNTSLGIQINQDASMNVTVRYHSSGIMHRLQADVSVYDQNAYSDLRVYIAFNDCSYKQRCGTSLSHYSHPWRVPQSWAINTLQTLYRVDLYSSYKKLENYNFTARGRVEDWQNPVSPNPYAVIFTDWTNITDY